MNSCVQAELCPRYLLWHFSRHAKQTGTLRSSHRCSIVPRQKDRRTPWLLLTHHRLARVEQEGNKPSDVDSSGKGLLAVCVCVCVCAEGDTERDVCLEPPNMEHSVPPNRVSFFFLLSDCEHFAACDRDQFTDTCETSIYPVFVLSGWTFSDAKQKMPIK